MHTHRIAQLRTSMALACAASLVMSATPAAAAPSAFNERPPALKRTPGAGTVTAQSSIAAAASAIADIPGTTLPSTTVTATLDAASDRSDVWAVHLNPTDHIKVTLTSPSGADFSPELWSPTTPSLASGTPLTGSYIAAGSEWFTYVATQHATYYVSVYAWVGSGEYTMKVETTPGEPNDVIPGTALPENTAVPGSVSAGGDADDVYAVSCVPGRHYYARLRPAAGSYPSIDAALFGPGSTDVLTQQPLLATILLPNGDKSLRWSVPAGGAAGTYYIDVRGTGLGGDYTLDVWSLPNGAYSDLPGGPLPGLFFYAPLSFSGNWDAVYGITLKANQRLTVRADWSTADAYPYLYAPGTPGLTGYQPLAGSETLNYPRVFTYTAPVAGTYRLDMFARYGAGSAPVTIKVASSAPVARVSGMTRYSGAVAIAKAAHGKFKYVKHVVIASGEDAAGSDPLIAAGLCGAYDAPMLLVKRKGMAPEVLAALKQMPKGVQVHVVGTPYNVNDSVLRTIRSLKNVKSVERIPSGPDRYSTAANVARRIDELRHARGWPDAPAVFIVNGADPAKYFDALAVGPIAAREMLPILLVQPDSVPPVTAAALAETRYTDIIVAGGPGTVGPAVESSVRATRRWWGADRYSTAAAIAEGAIDMHWITPTNVGLVAKVSDAVTGSTLLGRTGGILLVTKSTSLTPVTGDYVWSIRKQIGQGYVFGGPASVTAPTMTAFTNKINR